MTAEIFLRPRRRKFRPALWIGVAGLIVLYFVAIFAPFVAPYDYREQSRREPSAPPVKLHFISEDGSLHVRPFIFRQTLTDARDQVYSDDTSREYPVVFLTEGAPYRVLGLFASSAHLFGLDTSGSQQTPKLQLLGADQLGRDRFSRLVGALRFSLMVAPTGTVFAALIGMLVGGISGYVRPTIDSAMMGVTDTLISLPTLILILATRAAFPLELSAFDAGGLLIGIFALTGWGEIARLTRSLVTSASREEFVLAARASGISEPRILFRHIFPNIYVPILTQAVLTVPIFLLAEVSLSYLGIGLQEPEPSLGNMLVATSDLTQLKNSPLALLSPAIMIFAYVMFIRLVSRGLGRRQTFSP